MSHSVTIETEFKVSQKQHLVDALRKVFGTDSVEVHDTPQDLMTWNGREVVGKANIIVRKKNLRGLVNDLGFLSEGDVYKCNIDGNTQTEFMADIKKHTATNIATSFIKSKGWNVQVTTTPLGEVVIKGQGY